MGDWRRVDWVGYLARPYIPVPSLYADLEKTAAPATWEKLLGNTQPRLVEMDGWIDGARFGQSSIGGGEKGSQSMVHDPT